MADSSINATAPPALPPSPWTAEQLALLPHDSAGTKLNIAIWVMLSIAALFLSLRVYCKFLRHNGLWWDDYILIASWVSLCVECCLLSYAVSIGYGAHSWDFPFPELDRLIPITLTGGTFSVIAAIWSKTSFALTLLRLTDGWLKGVVWFIIVSMNIAMGLSALLPFVACRPIQVSWTPTLYVEGACWNPNVLINYDIFSASYSAAMDLMLALLPWRLVWKLQMKPAEKIGVAVAMSMGVFAAATALVKTSKLPYLFSADMYDGVDLFIWGNAESSVTIIAASIPILRVLVREARTSARNYYQGSKTNDSEFRSRGGTHNQHNTVSITATHAQHMPKGGSGQDDCSDKSILGMESAGPGAGRIVRTNEVDVAYQSRRDTDSEYEMQPV